MHHRRARGDASARYDRAIFLLLDGARADVFAELLAAGELPNVSRYLVEPGAHRSATTVFPSVTGVAYAPYVTGCFPQRTNVAGVRWFDRRTYARRKVSMNRFRNYVGAGHFLMDRDLSREVTTLFEILKPSRNIFGSISRGTGVTRNAFLLRRVPWALGFLLTGDWAPIDERANRLLFRAAARSRERFTFHTTLQVDEHSHQDGPFSPRARAGYRAFDRAIGELCARLRGSGRLDRTLLVLGSDHGHSEVTAHFDLEAFFEDRRLEVLHPKTAFKRWFDCDVAVMVGGNGMGHIYCRGSSWRHTETGEERLAQLPGLVDDLLGEPAVDILAWQPGFDANVRVRSRRGAATIRLAADQVSYVVEGSDPFGYPPLPKLMTRREALRVTLPTEYPDGIVQIAQIFGSPRAGDLVVTAARGWDLRVRGEHRPHRSGHGSLHRDHMLVPFAMNHRFDEGAVRSVDAYPTILRLLGEKVPPGCDGESLVA
jgi:hypothetical protein